MESNSKRPATDASTIINEDASPNPEFLIKSIAEQGYSLETSLADLMDNSISANANRIEILINMDTEPYQLFLADDGKGMSEKELTENMKFPSNSPEKDRRCGDLGRFGLGMKTASFSQTRAFTVLSRSRDENRYNGRTWDINYLKQYGWKIIVNNDEEIEGLLKKYHSLSKEFIGVYEGYSPNTIIIWHGLYKFEQFLDDKNRETALKKELNEVTSEHLGLVFHRFMEKKDNPLQIRINNQKLEPFNPFPEKLGIREIEPKQSKFRSDHIKIKGFVLPNKSIEESSKGMTKWTTRHRSLIDMEGLYIYRADRIIFFGGWNSLIKKSSKLQLARLRVEVGNGVDHLLHLNVSKSQIIIPFELRTAFENYIHDLKLEAEREFYNSRTKKKFVGGKVVVQDLFQRKGSNKGVILEINEKFPLVKTLNHSLDQTSKSHFSLLLRMINTRINLMRRTFEEQDFIGLEENDGLSILEIQICIQNLLDAGTSKDLIKEGILPNLGFKGSSYPKEILNLLD